MINISNWKKFKLSDLFTFERGKCSNAPDLKIGHDLVYVGAKKRKRIYEICRKWWKINF